MRSLRHVAPAAARHLAEQPVADVNATANDAQLVHPAQLANSLLQVVREGFVHPVDSLACHRLAVFLPSSDGGKGVGLGGSAELAPPEGAGLRVTHIVSQSDLLRFLHRHRAQLGPALLGSTLEQLGVGSKRVLCVPADLSVIEALAGMVDARVAAVAVVDDEESGRLIGALSVSDLRGLQPSHFEQLSQPVGDFLTEAGWTEGARRQPASPRGGVAEEFGIRSPEQLPHAPALAACTLGARFGDVLGMLAEGRLHRLFVVDEEGRPDGVVSLTDVLALVAG